VARVATVCYEITVLMCDTQLSYGANLDWWILSIETEYKFL